MKPLRFILVTLLFVFMWMFLHFLYLGVFWLLLSKPEFSRFYSEFIPFHILVNIGILFYLGWFMSKTFDSNYYYKH